MSVAPGERLARGASAPARIGQRRAIASACIAVGLAFGLATAAVLPSAATAQQGPQPMLPTVQLSAGMHLITAELAMDDASRMRGLMFRQQLRANHGMLFDFQQRAVHCMWMRNTLIPLSVAFLADDGTIVNIEDMAPRTEDSHCAAKPVRWALEMDKGWFAARGLRPGFKLGGIPPGR